MEAAFEENIITIRPEKNVDTDEERKTINKLKLLYLDTIKLEVAMQREIYKLEKMFEERHNVIFAERKKILDEFRKQNHGDSTPNENVKHFWLNVIKVSCTDLINDQNDEKILAYLSDVRSQLYIDDVVKFDLQFYFDKNEYFTNSVLTKTYFFNCTPDPIDPLDFDGAEITKCEGCIIDWKTAPDKSEPSFFDFFSPPILPDDTEEEYVEVHARLNTDFELGFYLKERVIPKAVLFFTGEIEDCESSSDPETDVDSDEDSNAEEEAAA